MKAGTVSLCVAILQCNQKKKGGGKPRLQGFKSVPAKRFWGGGEYAQIFYNNRFKT